MTDEPEDWRADPAWRLVEYDPAFYTERPADRPTPQAELAQPDAWASQYDGRRKVATWTRIG